MASTHRFEARINEELYKQIDSYTRSSGESKGDVFRRAMKLYLRAHQGDNDILLRDKKDSENIVKIELINT